MHAKLVVVSTLNLDCTLFRGRIPSSCVTREINSKEVYFARVDENLFCLSLDKNFAVMVSAFARERLLTQQRVMYNANTAKPMNVWMHVKPWIWTETHTSGPWRLQNRPELFNSKLPHIWMFDHISIRKLLLMSYRIAILTSEKKSSPRRQYIRMLTVHKEIQGITRKSGVGFHRFVRLETPMIPWMQSAKVGDENLFCLTLGKDSACRNWCIAWWYFSPILRWEWREFRRNDEIVRNCAESNGRIEHASLGAWPLRSHGNRISRETSRAALEMFLVGGSNFWNGGQGVPRVLWGER